MLDKLIDFVLQFLSDILPFFVVKHYDRAVRLRFGVKHCKKDEKGNDLPLEPGLHFKIPFVDQIYEHLVTVTTLDLDEQTITTKNNIAIVVKAVIKYEVSDVVTLLMEVNSPLDALKDMAKGIIRSAIINRNWDECNGVELTKEIDSKIKTESKKWGLKVIQVTLTDLAKMNSIRLLHSHSKASIDLNKNENPY